MKTQRLDDIANICFGAVLGIIVTAVVLVEFVL